MHQKYIEHSLKKKSTIIPKLNLDDDQDDASEIIVYEENIEEGVGDVN